jgi:catechol 2,3-dioxygenase-like lactoylglutathione lyase family enzyme
MTEAGATGPEVRELRLVVTVDDYDEAVHFYRDVLGLRERAVSIPLAVRRFFWPNSFIGSPPAPVISAVTPSLLSRQGSAGRAGPAADGWAARG